MAGKTVAGHERLHGTFGTSALLDHYLELLQRKPGGLEHSLALAQERDRGARPIAFDELWAALAGRYGRSEAARQMVDVLMLRREHGPAARSRPARTTAAPSLFASPRSPGSRTSSKRPRAAALARVVGRYARTELVVLTEPGYLALPDGAAELVFQVLSERQERGSLIVTPTCRSASGQRSSPTPGSRRPSSAALRTAPTSSTPSPSPGASATA